MRWNDYWIALLIPSVDHKELVFGPISCKQVDGTPWPRNGMHGDSVACNSTISFSVMYLEISASLKWTILIV